MGPKRAINGKTMPSLKDLLILPPAPPLAAEHPPHPTPPLPRLRLQLLQFAAASAVANACYYC